ncbi:MAG: hypothetical protein NTW19_23415 [Planctomycetota bacterium]|nr:hypothetical protein [Planctomycetota bacterium]
MEQGQPDNIRPAQVSPAEVLFADVLTRAIDALRKSRTPVYTFALYHDHESAAASVCVDTKSNSLRHQARWTAHSRQHFVEAVQQGDLTGARLWSSGADRSLSLGDFTHVNLARTDLGQVQPGKKFYLAMIRALMARELDIVALAEPKDELLFCCSGKADEVQYIWPPIRGSASSGGPEPAPPNAKT